MTRKVRIETAGVQTWAGRDEAGEIIEEKEETITTAEGTWSVQNGRDFLLYDEETQDGTVRTMIKLSPEKMEVIRSGAVRSRLALEPGRICETWYNLPAGRLALKIHTTGLEAVRENGCLRMVRAEYRLIWGDGMEVSCRLEVRVLSEA